MSEPHLYFSQRQGLLRIPDDWTRLQDIDFPFTTALGVLLDYELIEARLEAGWWEYRRTEAGRERAAQIARGSP